MREVPGSSPGNRLLLPFRAPLASLLMLWEVLGTGACSTDIDDENVKRRRGGRRQQHSGGSEDWRIDLTMVPRLRCWMSTESVRRDHRGIVASSKDYRDSFIGSMDELQCHM